MNLNDNKKKSSFWGVFYAPSAQQKRPISRADCGRVMRSGSSTTTGDVRHSGWMPEKLHNTSRSRNCTKKVMVNCLVFCGRSHPSKLLESGRNDYSGEVLPTNWRNAPESPTYVPEIGQYEGTNSPPWQCSPACCSILSIYLSIYLSVV